MTDTELLRRARAGDGGAFAELTGPYRRELLAHCYRMLASAQDAEDAMQDTILAAWQNLAGFEERASLRTWLYQIATNRCLNALRSASRRPATPHSAVERTLIDKLTSAYTAADLDSLIALPTDDVRLAMPPHPFEYRGRTVAAQGLGQLFAQGHRYRLIETRANGQPAFALYRNDPHAGILHASGLLVITLAGPGVSAMTMFTPDTLARFGLPRTLPA
jgi:RNA polymerase sigma factor (sigma-70 family)